MNTTILEVAPMQWADLKKLRGVEPISDGDLQCMSDVREVLKKHGKQKRFGMALLQKHFKMDDGEILVEDNDAETRELTLKPVKKEAAEETVPTIWMLTDGENRAMVGCRKSERCGG
jgi:hypothetical protein